jgi:HK97 family phage major capsid protein
MPPTLLEQALADLDRDLGAAKTAAAVHGGSRYVGPAAAREFTAHIAGGGTADTFPGAKGARGRTVQPRAGGAPTGFAKSLLAVAHHRAEEAGMEPVYASKALAELTDNAGGYLLTPEIADSVLMLIRARVAVQKMPITRVEPQSKQYLMPGLTTPGASASWLAENAAIPASAQAFQIAGSMVPRPLGALVAVSNRLLADATSENPSAAAAAESVIQADVADLMAVSLDAGFLQGDAAGPAPKGLLRTTGTTALSGVSIPTNGFSITSPPGGSSAYDLLVAIVGSLQAASLPFQNPGWIFAPRTLTSLMSLTDSLGRPLLASQGLLTVDPSGSMGTLLGYPFAVTGAMPVDQTQGSANNASTILFCSDWDEVWVGQWEAFALDASQEATYTPDGGTSWISAFQNMQTVFRATTWQDLAVRRPAVLCLVPGILP